VTICLSWGLVMVMSGMFAATSWRRRKMMRASNPVEACIEWMGMECNEGKVTNHIF